MATITNLGLEKALAVNLPPPIVTSDVVLAGPRPNSNLSEHLSFVILADLENLFVRYRTIRF